MNEVVVYVVNSLILEETGPAEQKRAHTQTKVYKHAYINMKLLHVDKPV